MNKKGFTLVEMLAVMVILSLLIIVAIPQIQNLVASKRKTVSEVALEMIYAAADDYLTSDSSTYQKMYVSDTERSGYCISVSTLVEAGKIDEEDLKKYIEYDDKDDTTDFLNRIVYAQTNKYNEFEYELLEANVDGSNVCSKSEKEIYKETELTGTTPKLVDDLIPVVYIECVNGGYWVIADQTTEWYSYKDKKWANAVTFSEKASDCESRTNIQCLDSIGKHNRTYYENAIPGTKISLDDVSGMYVWIPTGSGFWVGKFEASAPIDTSCFQEPSISNCDKNFIDLRVVPGRDSWKGISLTNAKTVVSNMASSTTSFGLNQSKVDTHLIKESEWNAIVNLTNSSYGNGTSNIYNNNYSSNKITMTGCSSGKTNASQSNTCSYMYNTANAIKGTTTGNIYGIYDMLGGANEYVTSDSSYKLCGGDYSSVTSISTCNSSLNQEKTGFRPVIVIK